MSPSPPEPAPAPASVRPAPPITRSCPACGGSLEAWLEAPSGEPSLPGAFALARCVACGTAVTLGRAPAFAAAHDAGSYATRRPRGAGLAAPLLGRFDRRRLDLLGHHGARPPGVLLDVGAGRGRFVAAAAAAGWDARGVEPAARGVEAAAEVYGVALERSDVDDAQVAPGSLDVVTLWHVLEHLAEPEAALRRCASWLRPGGVLLVGVPNRRSLQAWVGGTRWYHLDVPRHRTHFTAAGLRILLDRAGLGVVGNHQVLLEHNPFGLWQSALNRATGTTSHLFHLLRRAERPRPVVLAVTVLGLALLPVALAVEAVAGLVGRGGTMAVVARRAAE